MERWGSHRRVAGSCAGQVGMLALVGVLAVVSVMAVVSSGAAGVRRVACIMPYPWQIA